MDMTLCFQHCFFNQSRLLPCCPCRRFNDAIPAVNSLEITLEANQSVFG